MVSVKIHQSFSVLVGPQSLPCTDSGTHGHPSGEPGLYNGASGRSSPTNLHGLQRRSQGASNLFNLVSKQATRNGTRVVFQLRCGWKISRTFRNKRRAWSLLLVPPGLLATSQQLSRVPEFADYVEKGAQHSEIMLRSSILAKFTSCLGHT
jgi:hypothetical protein